MTASTISSLMPSISIILDADASSSSALAISMEARLLRGGEGGGVFSNLTVLSRFLAGAAERRSSSEPSLSLCVRFNLLLGLSSLGGGGILLDDDDVLLFGVVALADFFAAARAALEIGTWMPRDGRESDFLRVLYAMVAGGMGD